MRVNSRKTRHKSPKMSKFDLFLADLATELDIFDSTQSLSQWAFGYRDDLIRKIGPELKKICRKLKSLGLNFKIEWPVEIDGKWKFADVFFPRQRTVLIMGNPMNDFRPCCMLSDRAEFFRDRYRVVEVETLAELERKMQIKARTAG